MSGDGNLGAFERCKYSIAVSEPSPLRLPAGNRLGGAFEDLLTAGLRDWFTALTGGNQESYVDEVEPRRFTRAASLL
jgi:hypothetical protein